VAVGLDALARSTAGLLTPPLQRSHAQSTLLPNTWAKRVVLVAVIAVLVLLPQLTDYYQLSIAIAIGIGIIGAVATNLVTGVAGQASVGNSAFMAIGAFTAAQVGIYLGWPALVAIVVGGVAAALVGFLVAIPALRVRGLYLVIATLALHYVTIYFLTKFQSVRVGDAGFVMPRVAFGDLSQVQGWYYIILLATVLAVIAMRNLLRTRFGRAWAAIARDELGAAVMGVDVRRQKILVFGFTSLVIGIQGGLFGYYVGVVSIDPFNFDLAISFVAMIVIGGLGSTAGSVLGAVFVVGLPYAVTAGAEAILPPATARALTSRLFDFETVLYGLAIVVFLVWERRGLIFVWDRFLASVRTWPLSRPVGPDDA
jgi:branched-chain amino acid transport system permease protein